MKYEVFLVALSVIGFAGCGAKSLNAGADRVRFMQSEPKGCEYMGEATGNQGNFFTGGWTSNENLETGARNDLKNKAHAMGGNVVVMMTNRAGVTGSGNRWGGGSTQQTNVTYTGMVYRWPDSVLKGSN